MSLRCGNRGETAREAHIQGTTKVLRQGQGHFHVWPRLFAHERTKIWSKACFKIKNRIGKCGTNVLASLCFHRKFKEISLIQRPFLWIFFELWSNSKTFSLNQRKFKYISRIFESKKFLWIFYEFSMKITCIQKIGKKIYSYVIIQEKTSYTFFIRS